MRIRHKVPAIFSLSMVDMLCCALGCVILVWLLNAKQSEDDAAERRAEIDALTQQAESDRSEGRRLLSEARSEYDRATERVRSLTGERAALQTELTDLKKRWASLEASSRALETQLTDERSRARDLAGKLRTYGERVVALENDIREGTSRLDAERKKAAALARQVDERDATLKSARADLDKRDASLRTLQADLKTTQERQRIEKERADTMARSVDATEKLRLQTDTLLADMRRARERAESALAAREKALETARGQVTALEKVVATRQALVDATEAKLARAEADKRTLTAAAEARFAGIELTGQRVIFLVDTSGSMEMIDDSTEAPKKWDEVCQTVARVMRSLPRLEKYQVISFAEKIGYPLGQEGTWLNHEPKTAPEKARASLASIKPKGGTNMYAALDEAFRFRPQGLDTIYVLSDGLPNRGEGLTPTQQVTLKGLERGLVLGKHVRTTLRYTWNRPQEGQRVRIHTIGFFYESPDLGSFLWAMARENDGSFVGMSRP
ncbi:MAG: VWA domain-containing protein [Gemmataceae bacterium]